MADSVEVERDLEVLLKDEEVFEPPEDFVKQANLSDPAVYEQAEQDFEAWWEGWAKELDWFEPWETVLEWNPPWAKWFKEGKLNVSHNCLDRHVDAGRGERVAYHWVGEDGDTRDITYAELLDMTKRFANVLKSLGVEKGDVVGIYMPMLPETPAAMLACARIGATHNVVFGGFSVESVRERMEVSDAKVLVTADATLRRGKPTPMKGNVDEVLDQLPALKHVVVVKRTDEDCPMDGERDVWWHEAMEEGGGFLTLRRPWPGMLRTLFNEDERYVETYWSKYGKDIYDVGDAAKIDGDGYFWVVGRVDDVINVSGHRMSTMEIESAIVSHDKVAEAAVIGAQDEDTGQSIVAFVTLEGSGDWPDDMSDELREHVAKKIGKLARPGRFIPADDLPKTRSGKIMRRLLKDIAEGRELGDVTTLRDPSVTEAIEKKMKAGED
jgi:acyl-coenzyme A synthetase/AMP-(fatty) acid ligase